MEIKNILFMLRRWSWFLLLGLTIGMVSGFAVSVIMTPVFKAETKILISRDPQAVTAEFPNLNDIQLVQTYVEMLSTRLLLNQVSDIVGAEIDEDNVTVEQLRDTQIIQIAVEDPDPKLATDIANSMVGLLEQQINEMKDKQYLSTETSLEEQAEAAKLEVDSLQKQIDDLLSKTTETNLQEVDSQIATLENQVAVLQNEIAELGTPREADQIALLSAKQTQMNLLQDLLVQYQNIRTNLLFSGQPFTAGTSLANAQLEQLQTSLAYYEQLYTGYLSSLENLRLVRMQNTPTLTQIEPAVPPDEPDRPIPIIYTALAGLAGLIITIIAMIVIEMLDDTVRTPEDVEALTGAPVLGLLRKGPPMKNYFFQGKDITRQPMSALYEDFRSLVFQIENRMPVESFSSLMITSSTPREGKSTVAVNLATVFARNGRRVLLLDANQKNPRLPAMLGENPEVRLIDIESAAGERSRVPATLDMNKISAAFKNIKDHGELFTIIDTSPVFSADAKILASRVDGVLLVVEAWKTKRETLKATIHQLQQLHANLIGVVLNRIPLKYSYYYDRYHFLSSDYMRYTRVPRVTIKRPSAAHPANPTE